MNLNSNCEIFDNIVKIVSYGVVVGCNIHYSTILNKYKYYLYICMVI